MRTYTFAPGDIPKVLMGGPRPLRRGSSSHPLAACWTSELGGLNKFVHTCTRISTKRTRVREASRQSGGPWPPQTGVRPIR